MPYKDPKKQRAAMKKISRDYRKRQSEAKKKLALQFPDVYTLVFGKPLRRRSQK